MREAFQIVDKKMAAGNWSELSHDFNTCKPLSDSLDAYALVNNVAGIFMGNVQYCNRASNQIANVCGNMTASNDTYENLLKLVGTTLKELRLYDAPDYTVT